MITLKSNRREFVAVAATTIASGLLLPGEGVAQTGSVVDFSLTKFRAPDAGNEHSNQLRQIQKTLAGRSAISPEGLLQSVDALFEAKIILLPGAAILKKIIKELFIAGAVDIFLKIITDIIKALNDKIDNVSQAIVHISKSSVQSVKDILKGVDPKIAIMAVASDISGALTGAATGGQLGGPSGALVGAVLGAVSSSAVAIFGTPR